MRAWVGLLLSACVACDAPRSEPAARGASSPAATQGGAPAPPPPRASEQRPPAPLPTEVPARELTWVWDKTDVGPMHVVVSVPGHRQGQKLPVLVALHGRGEAFKGPARGARGWLDDYWMKTALSRLAAPPLEPRDLQGLAEPERLARFNAALAKQPYGGLIVLSAYTPDILAGDRPFGAATPFGKFVIEELLPRAYRETPAVGTPKATGIDGVSLGGRVSVLVGFEHARSFGVVGALQAAFDSADAPELARRAKQAREQNPELVIRLLSSDGDFFLQANKNISRALRTAGVEHELTLIPGPHDYVFNRGPGVYEMLLFHDRALRGQRLFD